MAIVNISFDSASKKCVVTVDGEISPADEVFFGSYVDYDGNPVCSLTCRRKVNDAKGFEQIQELRFPPPDLKEQDVQAKILAHFNVGLLSDTVTAEKVVAFLNGTHST